MNHERNASKQIDYVFVFSVFFHLFPQPMRPMLKKQFEDDLRTVFTAYKKQGSVEELRDLVNENLGKQFMESPFTDLWHIC